MKKCVSILIALILTASLLIVSAPASREPSAETGSKDTAGMAGGWTAAESPAITEKVQELVDRATEGLLGVDYVPAAYLGTQLVAGTNHCVLCQARAVYPGAKPYYTLVYLYEALSGNVEILDIETLDIGEMISTR